LLRRHFFLVAALVVLLLMLVVGGYKLATRQSSGPGGGGGQMAQGPGGPGGATQVSVATVTQRPFVDTLEVLGVAKGKQSVTLTAATTQLVQRVRFTDGQSVPAGAILVELKDTEQDAGLVQAQARLVEAERAFERYRTLGEKGFASKAQIDQHEAAYRSAQADVAAARSRQNDRMIRAPFAGVVGLSDVAPGALVNPGAPIVTLDDVSSIRVDFQVPERYLGQLREGQAITASVDAFPGEPVQGRIAMLDTRVDERTRAITARAEFPNPNRRLKPGMMIRVGISRGQRQGLSAPESAVSVQGDSAFVYVLQDQEGRTVTEQRPVVTGLRQDGVVELSDGVRAGERIVADGLNRIQPGQPVQVSGDRPVRADAAAAGAQPGAMRGAS
jgi:membrane fusion protein (multidrug efflux system)